MAHLRKNISRVNRGSEGESTGFTVHTKLIRRFHLLSAFFLLFIFFWPNKLYISWVKFTSFSSEQILVVKLNPTVFAVNGYMFRFDCDNFSFRMMHNIILYIICQVIHWISKVQPAYLPVKTRVLNEKGGLEMIIFVNKEVIWLNLADSSDALSNQFVGCL